MVSVYQTPDSAVLDQARYEESERLAANAARSREQASAVPEAPTPVAADAPMSERIQGMARQRIYDQGMFGMANTQKQQTGALQNTALQNQGALQRTALQADAGMLQKTDDGYTARPTAIPTGDMVYDDPFKQKYADGGEVEIEEPGEYEDEAPQGATEHMDIMAALNSSDPQQRIGAVGAMMTMILQKLSEEQQPQMDATYNSMLERSQGY